VKTFFYSVTKHDRREERTKLFVSAGRLQERRLQIRKLSWVRFTVKMLGLGVMIFPMVFNDTYQMIRPVICFRAIKIDMICKHLLDVTAGTLLVHVCTCTPK
jgi:hypothetical protein